MHDQLATKKIKQRLALALKPDWLSFRKRLWPVSVYCPYEQTYHLCTWLWHTLHTHHTLHKLAKKNSVRRYIRELHFYNEGVHNTPLKLPSSKTILMYFKFNNIFLCCLSLVSACLAHNCWSCTCQHCDAPQSTDGNQASFGRQRHDGCSPLLKGQYSVYSCALRGAACSNDIPCCPGYLLVCSTMGLAINGEGTCKTAEDL